MLIIQDNFRLLIDYGELHKYELSKIKPNAILITHAHPDHYLWTKKDYFTNIPIYMTKKTFDYGKFKPNHTRITTQINWCKEKGIKNILFTHLGKETLRKEKQFLREHPEIRLAYDEMELIL